MTHILLLGAGFSRNWGGWLAAEVFEYLLGSPQIADDGLLRNLLWKHKDRGGFEGALAELQRTYLTSRSAPDKATLDRFQEAVSQMFDDMNQVFLGLISFEFGNERGRLVGEFLARFDAMFTLNQDLLLERHYLNINVDIYSNQKWLGAAMPGVKRVDSTEPIGPHDLRGAKWQLTDTYELTPRSQPYFKLHGSSNWVDTEGNDLLIIGGNKTHAIQSHPTLKWYREQFGKYLNEPDSRLMVIGYGFGDGHINDAILNARKYGLRMFVVDPLGVDVVNKTRDAAIRADDPLEELMIGGSRRSLREIFGNDAVEHGKLMRFFEV